MADDNEVQKHFRVTQEEDARLSELVQLAHIGEVIREPTFQAYMMFALNSAYTNLKDLWKKTS